MGRKLVDALREYRKNNGLAGIVLYTAEHAPAMNFYEKIKARTLMKSTYASNNKVQVMVEKSALV
ncbi:MAG: hypothetical protein ACI4EF_02625 [Coprococcus sp.]